VSARTSKLRIESLEIEGFRGVSKRLRLDLVSGRTPASLILFGENGTGKSSIADALEVALQPQMAKGRGHARSFATSRQTRIRAELSDGLVVEQVLSRDGWIKSGHPAFALAPFVLRRADIMAFIAAADVSRQEVFFDLLKRADWAPWGHVEDADLHAAADALETARVTIRAPRQALADNLGIVFNEVPDNLGRLDTWLKNDVLRGYDPRRHDKRQARLRRPAPTPAAVVLASVEAYRAALVERQKAATKHGRLVRANRLAFRKNIIEPVLRRVGERLTASFREIANVPHIAAIELSVGDLSDVSLSLELRLANGRPCAAGALLSEAYLDLLALLVFLAFVKEAGLRGQAPILVLDDVLQSVDAKIRMEVTEYILDEFSDWQLFVTAHDRLWRERLATLFRATGHTALDREIVRWSFEEGPVIYDARTERQAPLEEALASGRPASVAHEAGRLLEEVFSALSWSLPVAVQRKRGDRYTLADLQQPIEKKLRSTTLEPAMRRVGARVDLRNLVGSHFNEWAGAASFDEAESFGDAVLALYRTVHCDSCQRWIARVGNDDWRCRCGALQVAKRAT
jgi:hypothetical protein